MIKKYLQYFGVICHYSITLSFLTDQHTYTRTNMSVCTCLCVYVHSEWVKVAQSCLTLWPHGLYSPWNSLGQNTGVGSLSLLQGIFPTQGSKPGLRHCRCIFYQLSHKGRPYVYKHIYKHGYLSTCLSTWVTNQERCNQRLEEQKEMGSTERNGKCKINKQKNERGNSKMIECIL